MKIALVSNTMVGKLSLPAGALEEKFWDHGHEDCVTGFGLRVRASGSRTWIFQYKFGAKHSRLRIGEWPNLSLEKARARARKYREDVGDGGHPAAERAKKKQQASDSFRALADLFLARQQKRLKPRSYVEVERHLLKHAKSLHDKSLASIDRTAIAALLSQISADRGPMAGNRLRASLSTFFVWAMKEGKIEHNPVISTNRAEETERDRMLSEPELREIWAALPLDDYGHIVKLLLLTGQRRDEIAGLRWSEIDFERGSIVLPGAKSKTRSFIVNPSARTKNKLEHEIPISEPVAEILKARKRVADRDLVFGEGKGGFQGWSNCKEALDARLLEARQRVLGKKAKPLPHWRLHDLRRTAATMMAEKLGVLPHVIEAVLNHISGHKSGVAGVYNRATYPQEKRRALDMWAVHVMSLILGTESNVVPLRAGIHEA
jgi:integrase